jgi:hypothetical protein
LVDQLFNSSEKRLARILAGRTIIVSEARPKPNNSRTSSSGSPSKERNASANLGSEGGSNPGAIHGARNRRRVWASGANSEGVIGSRTAYRGQRLRLSLAIRAVMVGTSSAHISPFFARSVRLTDVQNHNSGLFRFHLLPVATSYPSSQWSRFSS